MMLPATAASLDKDVLVFCRTGKSPGELLLPARCLITKDRYNLFRRNAP